ncbi:MAG: hypothetical protein ACYCS7_11250 [Acidimicrobiales bacterium]
MLFQDRAAPGTSRSPGKAFTDNSCDEAMEACVTTTYDPANGKYFDESNIMARAYGIPEEQE